MEQHNTPTGFVIRAPGLKEFHAMYHHGNKRSKCHPLSMKKLEKNNEKAFNEI